MRACMEDSVTPMIRIPNAVKIRAAVMVLIPTIDVSVVPHDRTRPANRRSTVLLKLLSMLFQHNDRFHYHRRRNYAPCPTCCLPTIPSLDKPSQFCQALVSVFIVDPKYPSTPPDVAHLSFPVME
jgi:hypothetical protein